jgi:hypothetical protein
MKSNTLSQTIVRLTLALTLMLGAGFSTARAAATAGLDDKAAFAKMKSLAGDWIGKDCNGHRMNTNIRVIAGGNTVLATFFPGTKMEMVTVYYLSKNKLVQTHYCVLGNQPHMKFNSKKSTADTIVFDFAGGDNIGSNTTHMHAETLHLVGKNKIENICTSCDKGKCEQHTSTLVRS